MKNKILNFLVVVLTTSIFSGCAKNNNKPEPVTYEKPVATTQASYRGYELADQVTKIDDLTYYFGYSYYGDFLSVLKSTLAANAEIELSEFYPLWHGSGADLSVEGYLVKFKKVDTLHTETGLLSY